MNRLDTLLLALLDGAALSSAEDAELAALLASPAERQRAILLLNIEARLRAREPLGSVAEPTLARLRAARAAESDALADEVLEEIASTPVMRWQPPARPTQRWLFLAAGAAAAVAVGAFVFWEQGRPAQSALQALAPDGEYGSVTIARGGATLPLAAGAALQPGDHIDTTSKGRVILSTDGGATRIELAPSTALRIAGTAVAPKFELGSGAVALQVAPRPPSAPPLEVATASAVAVVRGTQLRLAQTPGGAWLSVTEGAVDFAPRAPAAAALRVPAGHFAVIAPGTELRAHPLAQDALPRLPLVLDFSHPETFGDADWTFRPPQIAQRKVSRLPPFADKKGFHGSALASCMLPIPAVSGVLVEARVRIDAALDPASPEAEGGYGLGVRILSPREQFRFRSIEDPNLRVLSIGLTNRDQAHHVAEPRVMEFSHPPTGEWRLKFLATRLDAERTRLRGKFWPAADAEPGAWQLDTTGPATPDFHKIGVESTRLAVTWMELRASRVE